MDGFGLVQVDSSTGVVTVSATKALYTYWWQRKPEKWTKKNSVFKNKTYLRQYFLFLVSFLFGFFPFYSYHFVYMYEMHSILYEFYRNKTTKWKKNCTKKKRKITYYRSLCDIFQRIRSSVTMKHKQRSKKWRKWIFFAMKNMWSIYYVGLVRQKCLCKHKHMIYWINKSWHTHIYGKFIENRSDTRIWNKKQEFLISFQINI